MENKTRTYEIEARNEWQAKVVVETLLTKYRYLGIVDSFRRGRFVSLITNKPLVCETYQILNDLFINDPTF